MIPQLIPAISSRWTPAALGASLLGWWDASRYDLMTDDGAGLISSWRDVVAGYDATAATSARPTYSATSFNSRPGLTFDGTNNWLTYAGVGAFPTGASPSEIWALVDQTALVADTGFRVPAGYGGNVSNTRRVIFRDVATINRASAAAGTGSTNSSTANTSVDLLGKHVVRAVFDGANMRADVDGTAGASAAMIPGTGTTRTRIGASTADTPSSPWKGVIAMVAITSPLSAEQAASFTTYCKTRGGIA